MPRKSKSYVAAREAWRDDQPINMTELQLVQGVSSAVVQSWKANGLPRVGKLIRKSDFDLWWKKSARQHTPAHPPLPAVDIQHEQPSTNGLSAALPPRAARLRELAA